MRATLPACHAVLIPQTQDRRHVRMQDVRRGERLERRVPALPMRAQAVGDATEVLRNRGILQVRRKEPEASFEDLRRPGDAGAGEERGGDPALRREAGVQKLRLRPIDPALEESGGTTAGRARRPGQLLDTEPEDLSRAHGDAERREEPGRMKAAAMELPGRHAAHAAGDLVGDRDRENELASTQRSASRRARARPPPRDCSCARSTRCACRRTRAPATARRWRTPPSARRRAAPLPKIRAGPGGDSADAAAIVDRPNGVSAPASARPITSRMRSLVASTTSGGRSSYRTPDTHSAT